jgi:hypothetical protein
VLNQVATFGFNDTFERYDFAYKTSRAFRERHALDLLKGLIHGK